MKRYLPMPPPIIPHGGHENHWLNDPWQFPDLGEKASRILAALAPLEGWVDADTFCIALVGPRAVTQIEPNNMLGEFTKSLVFAQVVLGLVSVGLVEWLPTLRPNPDCPGDFCPDFLIRKAPL